MRLYQYKISGTIEYLLACPKAPGHPVCEPPSACEGHPFRADVTLYVEAPDAQRAIDAALGKLKGAYPYPLFEETPDITLVEAASGHTIQVARATDPLPGFEELALSR